MAEKHFEKHVNDGAKEVQPPKQVEMKDNGDRIDLPSRERTDS
jgi:hypothetical protein